MTENRDFQLRYTDTLRETCIRQLLMLGIYHFSWIPTLRDNYECTTKC